jgi:HAE1 family hydrophobic/amphiphilic exporter-1
MFDKFIHRPVLSIVISLVFVFLGLLALNQLPMSQFPEIAPPEVNVTTKYVGANAETCVKAVVTPIERAINGVPGMAYMSSISTNNGTSIIQIVFKHGTNPDLAAVNVQNRVSSVLDELPHEVTKSGVIVEKVQNSMLLYLNILSNDSIIDEKFLWNYTDINIIPELKRIDGVGFADIMGKKEYAMRIWLDPMKMTAYNISPSEISNSLKNQNIEAAPGKVGESSGQKEQTFQYVVKYAGKFKNIENYENIILKSDNEGKILKLKDVATIEFGSADYDVISKENGKPAAAIILKQRPGSNAKEVISNIKAKMLELEKKFPKGMRYSISYDVSAFLEASISDVIRTLIEAFILVSIVVFVFLQDWRSTLVPALSVPVSLIGTLFFMQLFGFSLNLITLFALVLAIGIVIDNAIVVVEAIHLKLEENHNLTILEATEKTMKEIGGAIIAITLVMSAVFVPVAFIGGPSGIFFKQFSITMAISILLSGLIALTLTPVLCTIILKNNHNFKKNKYLTLFYDKFNVFYFGVSNKYSILIKKIINRRLVTFLILLVFSFLTIFYAKILPSGFIPNEDQSTIYVSVTSPSGSTLERTDKVISDIEKIAQNTNEVNSISTLSGFNVLTDGIGANYGMSLISLKKWDQRDKNVNEVISILEEKTKHIKDANISFFTPPPIPGYGNSSGFELRLLDKTGTADLKKIEEVAKLFSNELNKRKEIKNAFTSFDASYPQIMLEIDYAKAAQVKVEVNELLSTLQTYLGSDYVTNFIKYGQMYKVMVQALPQFRVNPEDILKLNVKNTENQLVQIGTVVSIHKVYGPEQVTRYNMYYSAMINGEAAKGYSSGEAINAVKEVAAKTLPNGFGYDWAGSSKDQANEGNESIIIFLVSLMFVYLLLSAQYESFLLPLPVIFSLPTGVFGAFFLLQLMDLENNIYAQAAIIMLIGLLGKNAILIVEFASMQHSQGKSIVDSAIEAAIQRLRPILMTSFAFIAGLIPLMLASGAGAIGNKTIGAAAAGGMLFGTVFGVIVIPGLYVAFATISSKFALIENQIEKPLSEEVLR